jgi:hypothetical protein
MEQRGSVVAGMFSGGTQLLGRLLRLVTHQY